MGRFNWDEPKQEVPEDSLVGELTPAVSAQAAPDPVQATATAATRTKAWLTRALQALTRLGCAVSGALSRWHTRHAVPSSAVPRSAAQTRPHAQRSWGLLLWGVGALYCTAELIYNVALVELFSAPSVSLSTFEDIETMGKALAAFGLSLFVCRWWQPKVALPMFALCFPMLFVGIGTAYDQAIEALPKSAKTAGYYLGAYRNLVVNGDLSNPLMWDPQAPATTEQKILLTNVALVSYSGVDSAKTVLDWMYGSDAQIQDGMKANVESLFLGYASVMGKLEPFYAKYVIESRRWNSLKPGMFKDMYAKEFTRLTGGVEPGLDKVQFYDRMRQTNPALAQFHDAVIIEAAPKLGIGALRMGDIAPFSTQEQFTQRVFAHIQTGAQRARSAGSEVVNDPQAKRIIAAAYVPSISMALSLISLLLNTCLLASAPLRWVLLRVGTPTFAHGASGVLALGLFAVLWLQPQAPFSASMQQMLGATSGLSAALWQRATHVQWHLMQHVSPVAQQVREHLVSTARTESYERLSIQKVQPIALGNLEERMELLERQQAQMLASQQDLPVLDRDVVIDTQRLEKDPSYFGERKPTGSNPYLKR